MFCRNYSRTFCFVMDTSWTLLILLTCFCVTLCEDNVGPGIWSIIHMSPCPMADDYEIKTNMTKKKIDRGIDGFEGCLILGLELTQEFAVRVEICKVVEGGCKPFMVSTYDSFCGFMTENMPELYTELLNGWDVEPAECPVKEGVYCVSGFPFNYKSLNEEAIYGEFEAIVFVLDGPKEVMCFNVIVSFVKEDEE